MNPSLRVILLVVDHCNLNCRGCCAFAPLAKEYFVPLLDLERDCAKLADLTEGQIEGIGVFGGEPLLYPDLPELFVLLRRNFPQGAVFILTNGTLLAKQPERFWLSCAENKIEIALTKYPIALDYVRLERLTLEKGLPPLQYWGGGQFRPGPVHTSKLLAKFHWIWQAGKTRRTAMRNVSAAIGSTVESW